MPADDSNDLPIEVETAMFFRFAKALRDGAALGAPIEDAIADVEMMRDLTGRPALRLRCEKLLADVVPERYAAHA